MADLEHDSLASSQVHEPKHITLNGTSSSGRVITNSSTVAGTSEYRRLTEADISSVSDFYSVRQEDGTSTATLYLPASYNGTIVGWRAVQESALTTANNIYELRIDGVTVTGTPVTVLLAGAAGDQYSANASGANTFSTGQNIEVVPTTVGNTDATVTVRFVIEVQRD